MEKADVAIVLKRLESASSDKLRLFAPEKFNKLGVKGFDRSRNRTRC